MKIDGYIRDLRLQETDLKKKKNNYLKIIDKNFQKSKRNPEFHKIMKTKDKLDDIDMKLDFLVKLRKELIKNEEQDHRKGRI